MKVCQDRLLREVKWILKSLCRESRSQQCFRSAWRRGECQGSVKFEAYKGNRDNLLHFGYVGIVEGCGHQ